MTDVNVKDVIVRFWSSLHEGIFRVTEGQVLNRVLGMPVVRLTTVGRRTGVARVSMLTVPRCDSRGVIVVASNAGDHRHPDWYVNLLANPEVTVTMDGQTWTSRARVAGPTERAELWPHVIAANPGYAQYQAKTNRQIPLVILPPAPDRTGIAEPTIDPT